MSFLRNHSKPLNNKLQKIYHLLILVEWFWLSFSENLTLTQFLSFYLLEPNWKDAPVNWCVPQAPARTQRHQTVILGPEQSHLNALHASGDLHEPRVWKDRIFDQHWQHSGLLMQFHREDWPSTDVFEFF